MARGFALLWILCVTFLGRLLSFFGLALIAALGLMVSVLPARRSWRAIGPSRRIS